MPQLPALRIEPRNALLDLSPVQNALTGIQRQQNADREYGMQQEQLAMQKQSNSLQQQRAQREWSQQDKELFGKQAMAVDAMPDGPERKAAWARIIQSHGTDGLTPEEMDYRTGPKMGAAAAGIYRDPLEVKLKEAQIAKANREAIVGDNPSNVREWEYYNKLTPEQRSEYIRMKRADKVMDLGTSFGVLNPANPSAPPVASVPKDVAGEAVAKAQGKAMGEGAAALPKARVALDQYNQQESVVQGAIDKAIGQSDGWTTGFLGGVTSYVPGTSAHNLSNTLNTIKSNLGFDKLQAMRDASPTGGALGQVSEMENRLLQSVWGSIEQSQTKQQLVENLQSIKNIRARFAQLKQQAYEDDVKRFGAAAVPNPETGAKPADAEGWTEINGVRIREKR